MKIVSRIITALLFIVFFGFALQNTDEQTLHFYPLFEVHAPLALMLLGFFIAGAAIGVLAMMPTLFRHRRDLTRHKKAITTMEQEQEAQRQARNQPPQPDSVVTK